ncbi:hypothetical protein B6I55_19450, partial [Klebsiella pneumoniae]
IYSTKPLFFINAALIINTLMLYIPLHSNAHLFRCTWYRMSKKIDWNKVQIPIVPFVVYLL